MESSSGSSDHGNIRGVPTHGGRYVQYNVYGNLFEVSRKYVPPIRPVGRGAFGIVCWVQFLKPADIGCKAVGCGFTNFHLTGKLFAKSYGLVKSRFQNSVFPIPTVLACIHVHHAAVNSETREEVAIKKIGNAFDNRIDAKRTLREIKLLRHMDHENSASIYVWKCNLFFINNTSLVLSKIYS
ncbi:unnamed protein product, partial [Ilex paraguariensis]